MTKILSLVLLGGFLIAGTLSSCGADGDAAGVTLPASSCGEEAILDYECWVDEFPETPGRVDVRCGFTTYCCQEIVQTWEYLYKEAAGPRGVADEGTIPTRASCQDQAQLADLDGDGTLNVDDPDPTNTGDFQWE